MTDLHVMAALAGSAAAAAASLSAPSVRAALAIGEAEPWRWVVRSDAIDLYADRSRRPAKMDPDGRLMLMSSGGALHRARVALAADGVGAKVTLLPDNDADHLATVTATGRVEVTEEAKALYAVTGQRHNEFDRIADTPPPKESVDELVAVAASEGVGMLLLEPREIMELASATLITPKVRERVSRERSNAFAVLYGEDDTPEYWLRAGQAFSAVWLTAMRLGLSVVPSSAVVQLPGSREVMRRLLGNRGTPYLALRLGVTMPASPIPEPSRARANEPATAGPRIRTVRPGAPRRG
jgi:nitroreductase